MRDVVNGLTDLYMTSLSNRMNEIMKVLTIIGTIFIPLTFIAGIYGMNFAHMPELQYQYAYPIALGVMAVIAGLLLLYFRRKEWI
jgi:magnesium transporter